MGRGSSRPGASSMKNWPGSPVSASPRSSRRSVYGPIGSTPTQLCSLRRTLHLAESRGRLLLEPLLERAGDLGPAVRDRLDRQPRARRAS